MYVSYKTQFQYTQEKTANKIAECEGFHKEIENLNIINNLLIPKSYTT